MENRNNLVFFISPHLWFRQIPSLHINICKENSSNPVMSNEIYLYNSHVFYYQWIGKTEIWYIPGFTSNHVMPRKWIQLLLVPISTVLYFSARYLIISDMPAWTLTLQKVCPRITGLKHFPATQQREYFRLLNRLDESFPINKLIHMYVSSPVENFW